MRRRDTCFHLGHLSLTDYHELRDRLVALTHERQAIIEEREEQKHYWMHQVRAAPHTIAACYKVWHETVIAPLMGLAGKGPVLVPNDLGNQNAIDIARRAYNEWRMFIGRTKHEQFNRQLKAFGEELADLGKHHGNLMPHFFSHLAQPCQECALCRMEPCDEIDEGRLNGLCYLCAARPIDPMLQLQANFPMNHMCSPCAAEVAKRGTCGFCRGFLDEHGACVGRADWKRARLQDKPLRASVTAITPLAPLDSPSTI